MKRIRSFFIKNIIRRNSNKRIRQKKIDRKNLEKEKKKDMEELKRREDQLIGRYNPR